MNPLLVGGAAAAGAVVGLGSGWVAVYLERIERLREEEDEERLEYERDVAAAAATTGAGGGDPPAAEAWVGERYGWTWLERAMSPVLTAAGFAIFVAHGTASVGLLIQLVWLAVFVHIVAFDLKHRLILNRVTYPAIVIALAVSPVSSGLNLERAAIGCAGVALFFWLDARNPSSHLFPASTFDLRTTVGAGLMMVAALSISTCSFGFYGSLLLSALHGFSPLKIGLIIASESVAWSILSILVANAPPRREPVIVDYIESYIFNSDKCIALFPA